MLHRPSPIVRQGKRRIADLAAPLHLCDTDVRRQRDTFRPRLLRRARHRMPGVLRRTLRHLGCATLPCRPPSLTGGHGSADGIDSWMVPYGKNLGDVRETRVRLLETR
jgi:hypothetical protein